MELRRKLMRVVSELSDEQLKELNFGSIDIIIQNGEVCRLDIRTSLKTNYKIDRNKAD